MARLLAWTRSFNIATNPNNVNGYPNARWSVNLTSDLGEAGYAWPFNGTQWLGFKIIAWTQNAQGTVEMTRMVNGVDVGQLFTLISPPPEPPAVPTIFTDTGPAVNISRGDVINYRWRDSNRAGSDIFGTFFSYFSFGDGAWGF